MQHGPCSTVAFGIIFKNEAAVWLGLARYEIFYLGNLALYRAEIWNGCNRSPFTKISRRKSELTQNSGSYVAYRLQCLAVPCAPSLAGSSTGRVARTQGCGTKGARRATAQVGAQRTTRVATWFGPARRRAAGGNWPHRTLWVMISMTLVHPTVLMRLPAQFLQTFQSHINDVSISIFNIRVGMLWT